MCACGSVCFVYLLHSTSTTTSTSKATTNPVASRTLLFLLRLCIVRNYYYSSFWHRETNAISFKIRCFNFYVLKLRHKSVNQKQIHLKAFRQIFFDEKSNWHIQWRTSNSKTQVISNEIIQYSQNTCVSNLFFSIFCE